MLNFSIKSLYSFLAFTAPKENDPLHARQNIPSPVSGLTLITFYDNNNTHNNPINVVDSAAAKPPPPATKKDPGGIGFPDDVVVDGLTSCTESLGFESSDERRVDDDHDDHVMERIMTTSDDDRERALRAGGERKRWSSTTKRREEREERKFPPPLSSLDRDGRPSFFLRPVRRDGRLKLMEVKIDSVEVLHASRRDGRLRLDLVRDLVEEDEEEEIIDVDSNSNSDNNNNNNNNNNNIEEEEKLEEEKIGEEGESEKWIFPAAVNGGAGDGFRRCNEVVSHYHHHHHNLHHNLHAGGQHCLTIR